MCRLNASSPSIFCFVYFTQTFSYFFSCHSSCYFTIYFSSLFLLFVIISGEQRSLGIEKSTNFLVLEKCVSGFPILPKFVLDYFMSFLSKVTYFGTGHSLPLKHSFVFLAIGVLRATKLWKAAEECPRLVQLFSQNREIVRLAPKLTWKGAKKNVKRSINFLKCLETQKPG